MIEKSAQKFAKVDVKELSIKFVTININRNKLIPQQLQKLLSSDFQKNSYVIT